MRDGEPAPDIHADCRRRIEALEVEIEALEGESAESKRQNRSLLKRVEALEARLKQNSRNSSKPPSSDPPWTPSEASEAPSDRKRGGQPGHPGSQRKLVPPDQVDQIVEVKPTCCGRCGKRLGAKDRQPRRPQVWELPEADPQVTEFRLHTLAQTGATQDWRRHLTDCTISDDDAEVGIECLMVRRETGEVLRVRVSCWEGSSEPAQPPSHASAPARAQTKR